MANDLSRSPWILDTPSANPVKSSPLPNRTLLQGVIWYDYTTGAADELQITDDKGHLVVHLHGFDDLSPVSWFLSVTHPQSIVNLTMPVLSSGKVEVVIQ